MRMAKDDRVTEKIEFGPLPGYVGYQLRQAQAAVFRDFAQIMRDIGLTPGEFSLLTLVSANPGINQTTLAQVYQLDKSTLSHSVTKLENRSLINRERSQADKRQYTLRLTETGRDVLSQVTKMVEMQEDVIASVLNDGERQWLLDVLVRISVLFKNTTDSPSLE